MFWYFWLICGSTFWYFWPGNFREFPGGTFWLISGSTKKSLVVFSYDNLWLIFGPGSFSRERPGTPGNYQKFGPQIRTKNSDQKFGPKIRTTNSDQKVGRTSRTKKSDQKVGRRTEITYASGSSWERISSRGRLDGYPGCYPGHVHFQGFQGGRPLEGSCIFLVRQRCPSLSLSGSSRGFEHSEVASARRTLVDGSSSVPIVSKRCFWKMKENNCWCFGFMLGTCWL